MPYISQELRTQYDRLTEEFFHRLDPIGPERWICIFVMRVAEKLYGVEDTRYWRQNEFMGILSCATYEWRRRTLPSLLVDYGLPLNKWRNPPAWLEQLAVQASVLLTACEDGLRPGCFNYLISKLLVDGVALEVIEDESSALLLLEGMQDAWYFTVIAPYENRACLYNGDLFDRLQLRNLHHKPHTGALN